MTAPSTILAAAPAIKRREHNLNHDYRRQLGVFSKAVVARRLDLGFTRKALAAEVGLSYAHMAHIEGAEHWPTVPVYLKLCRVLKVGKVPLME